MKTFEEAVNAVLCREVTAQDNAQDLEENSGKYHDTLREIQTHDLTGVVVQAFMAEVVERGIPIALMLAVVFSHGVMVGMEMERQEFCPTLDSNQVQGESK